MAKTVTLDARIAAALSANGEAIRETLVALVTEATKAIETAQTVIETETPRLHDLSNDNPDESLRLIESSKLRVERLTAALSHLQQRIDVLDRETAAKEWEEKAAALQSESDLLWSELEAVYNVACDQIIEVWSRVSRNWYAIRDANQRRPSGVRRELLGADHPELRSKLRLPYWDDPDRVRFPLDEMVALQRDTSLLLAEQARAWEQKQLAVLAQRDELVRAEHIKNAEQTKQRAEQEKQVYYKSLKEADRRRQGITP